MYILMLRYNKICFLKFTTTKIVLLFQRMS